MSRLRIASYYEHRLGRNDGNPLYVSHVLRRDYADRVEFHHLLPDPALQFATLGRYDGHLWVDWGEDALAECLPYTPLDPPAPSVYWASDTHLGLDYRVRKARACTHVFVAQREAVAQFADAGVSATWLPHAVEPDVYNPAAVYTPTPEQRARAAGVVRLPTWDVCFVGHLNTPARVALVDAVFRAVPNAWFASRRTGRLFERVADVFTRSRVVLNHAVRGDLNMRVFEALATRRLLVTPDVPGLRELFTPGVHLVTYRDGDVADCVEKVAYYADDAHADARERIAEAGYQAVLAAHTMAHRVARLLAPLLPPAPDR